MGVGDISIGVEVRGHQVAISIRLSRHCLLLVNAFRVVVGYPTLVVEELFNKLMSTTS